MDAIGTVYHVVGRYKMETCTLPDSGQHTAAFDHNRKHSMKHECAVGNELMPLRLTVIIDAAPKLHMHRALRRWKVDSPVPRKGGRGAYVDHSGLI